MITTEQDILFMGIALEYAARAAAGNEVPVGAVLVDRAGSVIAGAGNNCIAASDPAGHAEIRVLRAAAAKVGNYRLPETTMYATLEPCPMCAAAMVHARIERIVFGAEDPKTGGLQSRYTIGRDGLMNHSFVVRGGVCAGECSSILRCFFKERRAANRKQLGKDT